ncbi:hypothetical protein V490_00848 [Pseudogymnoascus sp. VKM F-3557]|nr:hypothetical protein V490_00848 [Pseudogymnoascus sp. VKM F-3557]
MNNKNENREPTSPCDLETRFQDSQKDKDPNSNETRQKLIPEGENHPTHQPNKEKKIQGWLSGVATETLPCRPDEYSTYNREYHSIDAPSVSTRSSVMVAVDVHDSDYRESLGYYNIYIQCMEPPMELMHRAKWVIDRPRESPRMGDAAVQELMWTIGRLQTADEDAVKEQLAPKIVPAVSQALEKKLSRVSGQLWFRAVAVPLLPDFLDVPSLLLLPRPKPDVVFGYPKQAFTTRQIVSILRLVDDESKLSYAMPDQKTCFPFLAIEFKSQAKKGTHYVATNQTAGAGAIALNGQLELMRRSCSAKAFDINMPRFFSVTIDQAYAQINVHWVGGGPAQGEPYSFHVERVARHFLDSVDGMGAVAHAVGNIIDYGVDILLPGVCEALDAYRAAMVAND